MVRFDEVGLRYGRAGQGHHDAGGPEVLHDLSFVLPDGAFRWLLGASGAGKTSMLRLMYLAVRPTRGKLSILGMDIDTAERRRLPRLRRRIGVVFQDFRLLPHLSAFDNVALPLRIAGRPEGQIKADVGEMLRWVGLAKQAGARPAALLRTHVPLGRSRRSGSDYSAPIDGPGTVHAERGVRGRMA